MASKKVLIYLSYVLHCSSQLYLGYLHRRKELLVLSKEMVMHLQSW